MATLIRDIVSANEKASFENDIQLSWYPDDSHSPPLCCGYIFTSQAVQGKKSSIDLLNEVYLSFLHDGRENRFVFLATYGHGKSHFALTLANFFGKPKGSKEVECILSNIRHAVGDAPITKNFEDFKESRKPYLVVRIRGDKAQSLHQQFLTGLEQALKENESTKDVVLPFWFNDAKTFVERLSGEDETRANDFLAKHRSDISSLKKRIQDRDSSAFQLCVDLHRCVMGYPSNFGGEVSLQHVVEWVTLDLCGDDKPLPGILILFDEFSQFVRDYAKGHGSIKGAPLQDLLDGVKNSKNKAVFIALAQIDPDTAADNAYKEVGNEAGKDDLRRELERLRKDERHSLHSSMETVLDAYLKQVDEAWNHFVEPDSIQMAVDDANDETMRLFPDRYDSRKGWSTERFADVVTKGCFPLHPLTTALLCSVELRQVTNPRNILGFVLNQVRERSGLAAVVDNRPNWVYAIELVDWFRDMLADAEYEQYRSTKQLAGPDINQIQQDIFKALLLHTVAQLKTSKVGFIKLISLLTGHTEDECRKGLDELHDAGYIRFDETHRIYTFYPLGKDPHQIEKWLKSETADKTMALSDLQKISQSCAKELLTPVSVGCNYGHAEDWAAQQILLTRSSFNESTLKTMLRKVDLTAGGFSKAARGYLVWLLARNSDDVTWFRSNAESILDLTLDDTYPPVVVVLPTEPSTGMEQQVLRYITLDKNSGDLQREYGYDIFVETQKRISGNLVSELKSAMNSSEFVVPHSYRLAIKAFLQTSATPANALKKCYELAYNKTPDFYTQYKSSQKTLIQAVGSISKLLASNGLAGGQNQINGLAESMFKQFLAVGNSTSWGLTNLSGRLQSPHSSKVQEAWKLLDSTFAPAKDKVKVKPVLLQLLNVPFAYDYPQLLLLFSAWFGHNKHDLQLSENGRVCSLEEVCKDLSKPEDAVYRLCYDAVSISRKDPDRSAKEARDLIAKVKKESFSAHEADGIKGKLDGFCKDDRNDPSLIQDAHAAIQTLEYGLDRAKQYDAAAERIQSIVENAREVSRLASVLKEIEKLPNPGCVTVSKPAESSLRDMALKKMSQLVNTQCSQLQRLSDIKQYGKQKAQLQSMKAEFPGKQELLAKVDQAMQQLDQELERLERKQNDSSIVAKVQAISAEMPLAQLREQLKDLKSLTPLAEETKQLIQRKEKEVSKAISDDESFACGILANVDEIDDELSARNLGQKILRRLNRYKNTSDYQPLEKAADRCEKLEAVMRSLSSAGNKELRNQTDFDDVAASLRQLERSNANFLCASQVELIHTAQTSVQVKLDKKVQQAKDWLEKQETATNASANPESVLRNLDNPPAFLPSECGVKLSDLREKLRKQCDEDEVGRVVSSFQRISDAAKRKECLKRLQELLSE